MLSPKGFLPAAEGHPEELPDTARQKLLLIYKGGTQALRIEHRACTQTRCRTQDRQRHGASHITGPCSPAGCPSHELAGLRFSQVCPAVVLIAALAAPVWLECWLPDVTSQLGRMLVEKGDALALQHCKLSVT